MEILSGLRAQYIVVGMMSIASCSNLGVFCTNWKKLKKIGTRHKAQGISGGFGRWPKLIYIGFCVLVGIIKKSIMLLFIGGIGFHQLLTGFDGLKP